VVPVRIFRKFRLFRLQITRRAHHYLVCLSGREEAGIVLQPMTGFDADCADGASGCTQQEFSAVPRTIISTLVMSFHIVPVLAVTIADCPHVFHIL